jgi:hypothetical protein
MRHRPDSLGHPHDSLLRWMDTPGKPHVLNCGHFEHVLEKPVGEGQKTIHKGVAEMWTRNL